jgi:hypothetical protein
MMKMIIAVGSMAARVGKLVLTEADFNTGLPSYSTPKLAIRIPHSYLDGTHLEIIQQDKLF